MSTHYKQPILLIEFEENKSFSLQVSSLWKQVRVLEANLLLLSQSLVETTSKPWEREKVRTELSDTSSRSHRLTLVHHFLQGGESWTIVRSGHPIQAGSLDTFFPSPPNHLVILSICNCRHLQRFEESTPRAIS